MHKYGYNQGSKRTQRVTPSSFSFIILCVFAKQYSTHIYYTRTHKITHSTERKTYGIETYISYPYWWARACRYNRNPFYFYLLIYICPFWPASWPLSGIFWKLCGETINERTFLNGRRKKNDFNLLLIYSMYVALYEF